MNHWCFELLSRFQHGHGELHLLVICGLPIMKHIWMMMLLNYIIEFALLFHSPIFFGDYWTELWCFLVIGMMMNLCYIECLNMKVCWVPCCWFIWCLAVACILDYHGEVMKSVAGSWSDMPWFMSSMDAASCGPRPELTCFHGSEICVLNSWWDFLLGEMHCHTAKYYPYMPFMLWMR